ncbi:MAG: DUF2955 domain-containing protein [Myxococcota bacterium]
MTELAATRTIRFAAGTSLAAAFAFGLDYSLGVVTPMMAAVFLSGHGPRPTLSMMGKILFASACGLGLGILTSLVGIHSPSLLFLAVGLMLFRIFLAAARGTSPFLVLMLLIGVLLVPVLASVSIQIAWDFFSDFLVALALALAFVQLAFQFFPDPERVSATAAAAPSPPPPAQLAYALQRTAVFLPLFAGVFTLQLTGQLQALLYAVILSLGAQPRGGWKTSLPMLGGALIGGACAVVIYLTTSMIHEYVLMTLMVALALVWIARGQFTEGRFQVYFASAPGALLILVSSTDSIFGDETGAKFFTRLTSIIVAAAIVSVGLAIAESLLRPRTTH